MDVEKMSVIFSDEEMTQLEGILGMEFIELYQKLWSERASAKSYHETVMRNIETTSGYTKMYWMYKLQEVRSVIENQSKWFRKVVEPLKEKISEEMWSKLEDYLDKNEVLFPSIEGE